MNFIVIEQKMIIAKIIDIVIVNIRLRRGYKVFIIQYFTILKKTFTFANKYDITTILYLICIILLFLLIIIT